MCKYMTSVSKSVFIYKLNDRVNKCNNTYHSTISRTPFDVKSNSYIDSSKVINNEGRKFKKILLLLEYQKTKIFWRKVTLQMGIAATTL